MTMPTIRAQVVKQSGFTLLEVLISLVILAIGLLGLSALQVTGLKDNLSAYQRSQATQLTYDIIDRMRANKISASNYLTSYMAPSTATQIAGCSTSAGCNASQMAQNDLYEWNTELTDLLPNGKGTITVSGDTYTVSVSWDENRDGTVDANDPNFKASFQL